MAAYKDKDVLFLATANRLDTLPPELQHRFNLGIWFFDVPCGQEQASIWNIQARRVGLEPKDLPEDSGWVGNMAGEYHASADDFIKLVHQLAGGTRETQVRGILKGEDVTILPWQREFRLFNSVIPSREAHAP